MFIVGSRLLSKLPLCFYVVMTSVHQTIICIVLACVLDPSSASLLFSMDKYVGLFGFFDRSQALIALIPFALLGGFFGGTGYVIATKFFPPVVTATALLVELPISQLIGYYLGIDKFPGT